MGQNQSGMLGQGGPGKDKKEKKEEPKKWEPPPAPSYGRKKKKSAGQTHTRLPKALPNAKCKLRFCRLQRVADYLEIEQDYIKAIQVCAFFGDKLDCTHGYAKPSASFGVVSFNQYCWFVSFLVPWHDHNHPENI